MAEGLSKLVITGLGAAITGLVVMNREEIADSAAGLAHHASSNKHWAKTHNIANFTAPLPEELKPAFNRENEVETLATKLSRTTGDKCNVVITGRKGTGKSAVVDEFERRRREGEFPALEGRTLISLKIAKVQGSQDGSKLLKSIMGQSEESNLRKLFEDLKDYANDYILFVDEAHCVSGLGIFQQLMGDLARGQLPPMVWAMTDDNFVQYWPRQDDAFGRRFDRIEVREFSRYQTMDVLTHCADNPLFTRGRRVSQYAIGAIVNISDHYIKNHGSNPGGTRTQPDVSIALLGEVCREVERGEEVTRAKVIAYAAKLTQTPDGTTITGYLNQVRLGDREREDILKNTIPERKGIQRLKFDPFNSSFKKMSELQGGVIFCESSQAVFEAHLGAIDRGKAPVHILNFANLLEMAGDEHPHLDKLEEDFRALLEKEPILVIEEGLDLLQRMAASSVRQEEPHPRGKEPSKADEIESVALDLLKRHAGMSQNRGDGRGRMQQISHEERAFTHPLIQAIISPLLDRSLRHIFVLPSYKAQDAAEIGLKTGYPSMRAPSIALRHKLDFVHAWAASYAPGVREEEVTLLFHCAARKSETWELTDTAIELVRAYTKSVQPDPIAFLAPTHGGRRGVGAQLKQLAVWKVDLVEEIEKFEPLFQANFYPVALQKLRAGLIDKTKPIIALRDPSNDRLTQIACALQQALLSEGIRVIAFDPAILEPCGFTETVCDELVEHALYPFLTAIEQRDIPTVLFIYDHPLLHTPSWTKVLKKSRTRLVIVGGKADEEVVVQPIPPTLTPPPTSLPDQLLDLGKSAIEGRWKEDSTPVKTRAVPITQPKSSPRSDLADEVITFGMVSEEEVEAYATHRLPELATQYEIEVKESKAIVARTLIHHQGDLHETLQGVEDWLNQEVRAIKLGGAPPELVEVSMMETHLAVKQADLVPDRGEVPAAEALMRSLYNHQQWSAYVVEPSANRLALAQQTILKAFIGGADSIDMRQIDLSPYSHQDAPGAWARMLAKFEPSDCKALWVHGIEAITPNMAQQAKAKKIHLFLVCTEEEFDLPGREEEAAKKEAEQGLLDLALHPRQAVNRLVEAFKGAAEEAANQPKKEEAEHSPLPVVVAEDAILRLGPLSEAEARAQVAISLSITQARVHVAEDANEALQVLLAKEAVGQQLSLEKIDRRLNNLLADAAVAQQKTLTTAWLYNHMAKSYEVEVDDVKDLVDPALTTPISKGARKVKAGANRVVDVGGSVAKSELTYIALIVIPAILFRKVIYKGVELMQQASSWVKKRVLG